MSAASIEVSYPAYSTLILHCAKYPASEVMGFLLGNTSSSKVTVEKSIPVQHHWNRLSPMVEVAASLAQAHTASQASTLQLVGIYYAPSDVPSSIQSDLSPTATKLAQSMSAKLGKEAVVLKVNNSLLNSPTAHALHGFSVSSSNTKTLPLSAVQLRDESSITQVRKAIAEGTYSHVVDFDDHLEDTSLNWLEQTVAA